MVFSGLFNAEFGAVDEIGVPNLLGMLEYYKSSVVECPLLFYAVLLNAVLTLRS